MKATQKINCVKKFEIMSFDDDFCFSTSAILTDTEKYINIDSGQMQDIKIGDIGKYSVFDIANWFLEKEAMTNKKLQKLCYYAQAWCYALKGYKLEDTDFQAWVHGPVSPALWERFKSFGYNPIKIDKVYEISIDTVDVKLLEDVWDTYGESTGNALEALTHRELPWQEARKGYRPDEKCTIAISPDTMARYYRSIYCGD